MNRSKSALLAAAAMLACLACSHNVSYSVGLGRTPRADFGTAYVLALADFKDGRTQEPGEERVLEGAVHRHLEDKSLAYLSADVPDALAKHLAFTGLFKGVVREGERERAHLLLSGEIQHFRVAARADFLDRAKAAAEAAAEAAVPEKTAPPVTIPVRSHIALRLTLWRVDKKAPVWTGSTVVQRAKAYSSMDLPELTNLAFLDAMKQVVTQLTAVLAPHRSGPPHPVPVVTP